ncbi:barstar family protein [Paenibacillus xylanexedens]|uniref:barstar family protein n=1 Tax=Paenibacillus xylanexedens TaxID=528191 RepID=UPI0011AB1441|nr:barstar family protein [Paenibacillus xylanexedens]
MTFPFVLLDDSTDLIIGHCTDIVGLDGTVINPEESYHQIILKHFVFSHEFQQYILQKKEPLSRYAYVGMLNKDDHTIGYYGFFIHDTIKYHKLGFPTLASDLKLNVSIHRLISAQELQIWDQWRISLPTTLNQWATYDENGRRAWLSVVKSHNNMNITTEIVEKTNDINEDQAKTFQMDGTYMTSYASFFCALGEAMNGPGGYYGSDFNSFIDCTYGGFGAIAPFTLKWANHQVARSYLDNNAWHREIDWLRAENERLGEEDFEVEIGNRPLYEAIIENLEHQGITVILQ